MGTRISIRGWGAVSPAGWGAEELAETVLRGTELPTSVITREGKSHPSEGRRVPNPEKPPPFLKDPRLRRTSIVGRYGVAAALEALGDCRADVESGELRTGIVFCEMNGIVDYSRRFYQQVLDDPAYASPILFPETVYNAPSSHLSALLGSPEINYTILGDSSTFVAGLDLAARWLSSDRIDACLVVAAEELDWLSAEAFQLFEPNIPVAEGAAALFLERSDSPPPREIELAQITGPKLYSSLNNTRESFQTRRVDTGKGLREELESSGNLQDAILIDGTLGGAELDKAEDTVWSGWERDRFAPLSKTGAGFAVSAGWQCVLATHLLQNHACQSAAISALGGNQQAAAAVFRRV